MVLQAPRPAASHQSLGHQILHLGPGGDQGQEESSHPHPRTWGEGGCSPSRQTTASPPPKLCTVKRRPSSTTSASPAARLPASPALRVWTARSPVWMAATAPMVCWGGGGGRGEQGGQWGIGSVFLAWMSGNQGLRGCLFVE